MLESTDREFCWKTWGKGERIEPLDYVCADEAKFGDTFVWASIQMRARNPRVLLVPQHSARPADVDDFESRSGIFAQDSPWVHFGALASGTHALVDDEGISIARRATGERGQLNDIVPGSAREWEKKLAMWMLCREQFPITDARAAYYDAVFDRAISNILWYKQELLDFRRIRRSMAAYAVLFASILD